MVQYLRSGYANPNGPSFQIRLRRNREALGVDPYSPKVADDDPRFAKVQAVVAEYRATLPTTPSIPEGWEGRRPGKPVATVSELSEWLEGEWLAVLASQNNADQSGGLEAAHQSVRNCYRILDQLGIADYPTRPPLPPDIYVAEKQLRALADWLSRKSREQLAEFLPQIGLSSAKMDSAHKSKGKAISPEEADTLVKRFLENHPKATVRQVAAGVGVSVGRVCELAAWRTEQAKRKAARTPKPKSSRPLTGNLLATIGKQNDPSIRVQTEELVWNRMLAKADKEQQEKMHLMTHKEREELVRLAIEDFPEELLDPDDCS